LLFGPALAVVAVSLPACGPSTIQIAWPAEQLFFPISLPYLTSNFNLSFDQDFILGPLRRDGY